MRTVRSASDERTAVAADPGPTLRSQLPTILVVCLVAGAIAAFYLALYPVKRYPMPIGWDTPRYLAKATVAGARGLAGVPRTIPPPAKALASRAGFPITVLSLSSLFTASTFKLAQTVPVAAVVAIALAAGALVSAGLRRTAWDLAVVGALVGVSPVLVRLMAPETYIDNMLFAALVTAALIPMLFAVRDGEGILATILLLTACALAHPTFFGAMFGVLVVVLLVLAPESWRAWREGTGIWRTPGGRLGGILVGSGALAAVGMFGLLRKVPETPLLSRGELRKKLREDVGLYLYPVTVPLAVIGAAVIGGEARPKAPRPPNGHHLRSWEADPSVFAARFLLILLLSWGATVGLGVAAFFVGRNVPAHRFLAMLVPLPILAGVGVLAMGRWASTWSAGGASRVVRVAVAVAGVTGMAFVGGRELYVTLPSQRGVEWLEYHKVQDTANAAAYLDAMHVPGDAPVVFVVDDLGNNPLSNIPEQAYIVRSALPADRILHSWFYAGNPQHYLAREPTLRDHPLTYNANSMAFWRPLDRMLSGRSSPPVAILLKDTSGFWDREIARHPTWEVAPGVMVLEGPRPARMLPSTIPPWGLRSVPQGLFLVGTIVVLAAIGLGWALALLPRRLRPYELVAVSPAFGIGFLLLTGLLIDSVGIRLQGVGGSVAILAAATAGWLLAARRLRAGGRSPGAGPGHPQAAPHR